MPETKRNPGWIEYRPPLTPERPSCTLVLGTPRGGTTLIAHTLATLGVFMGEKLPYTAEDPLAAQALEAGDRERFAGLLAQRAAGYAHWGLKYPELLRMPEALQALPANTRVVFVFRDFLATALRNHAATGADVFESIHANRAYQEAMLAFAESTAYPLLMISYEKALLRPEPFIRALGRFVGLDVPESAVGRALKRVRPSPVQYEAAAESGSRGWPSCVDRIREREISGWAFEAGDPANPVELEMQTERGTRFVFSADRVRNDLAEQGIHPSGRCGFRFTWESEPALEKGEVIWLRFRKSGVLFEGGPFIASF